jgi:hypothetical protein
MVDRLVLRPFAIPNVELTIIGVGLGLIAAAGLARLMESALFGIVAIDGSLFLSVTLGRREERTPLRRSVESEIHHQPHPHGHRLSVQGGRLKAPPARGDQRLLVESVLAIEASDDPGPLDRAVNADDDLEFHGTLDLGAHGA